MTYGVILKTFLALVSQPTRKVLILEASASFRRARKILRPCAELHRADKASQVEH